MLLSDHLVALSVELDDVGANGSYGHSAHLGNLRVGQNFSVEPINRSVPVLDKSQYLVRSQMASNNSWETLHIGKIYIITPTGCCRLWDQLCQILEVAVKITIKSKVRKWGFIKKCAPNGILICNY